MADACAAVPSPADSFESTSSRALKTLSGLAPTLGASLATTLEVARQRRSGALKPISTPWPGLNSDMNGGLWPGLTVLVGSTGVGKSAFALQQSLCAAKAGTPVLYVALELDRGQIVTRLASMLAHDAGEGFEWGAALYGTSHAALSGFERFAPRLDALPVHILEQDARAFDVSELRNIVSNLREAYHVGKNASVLVVLDYLQLIGPGPEGLELRERMSAASMQCRDLARKLNATVLMLSSTSREGATRLASAKDSGFVNLDAGEFVGTGKESGDIEYSADNVLVLCPEAFTLNGETRLQLGIAKQRAGSRNWLRLLFNGARLREEESLPVSANQRINTAQKKEVPGAYDRDVA